MTKMKVVTNLKSSIFLLLFIFTSCDFTSSLHKDILKAQQYVDNKDFIKATQLYEEVLRKRSSKTIQLRIHIQLGDIYTIYLNRYEESLRHYKKILDLTSDPLYQVKALEKIGTVSFENLSNYQVSKDAYKKLINFEPALKDQELYRFKYAESLVNLKEYKKAELILNELIQNNKSEYSIKAYYSLGMINFYKKNWDEAINNFFEYIKREKRQDKIVQTKFLIANAYETSEKLKEAYNIYYSILGEYPNTEVIKNKLQSIYNRRLARKR